MKLLQQGVIIVLVAVFIEILNNAIDHGTIIRTGITCKKFLYKSLLNSAWLRAPLVINKKQKYLPLPDW